jgi:hypothetical protein
MDPGTADPVESVAYLAPFVAFLLIYASIRLHAERAGTRPPIQWSWLAAIAGCAAAAVLTGLLL